MFHVCSDNKRGERKKQIEGGHTFFSGTCQTIFLHTFILSCRHPSLECTYSALFSYPVLSFVILPVAFSVFASLVYVARHSNGEAEDIKWWRWLLFLSRVSRMTMCISALLIPMVSS